jgi:hypothetical protein
MGTHEKKKRKTPVYHGQRPVQVPYYNFSTYFFLLAYFRWLFSNSAVSSNGCAVGTESRRVEKAMRISGQRFRLLTRNSISEKKGNLIYLKASCKVKSACLD